MSSKIKSFLHVPLSVLFCALLAAGFFSCAALDSPDDSSCGAVYEIKGTLLAEGAFPADFTAAQNSTGLSENARSGSAGIKGSVYYTVKAVNAKTSSEYKGAVSGNSFSVKVPKGSWNILAEGFSDEGKSVQILKGSAEVSVDDDYSVKSGIEVAMSPLTDGAGDILLKIQKTADSGIKSFRARLEKLGGDEPVSSEPIDFPSDSDSANFKKNEIDSGTYILHLEFYSEADCAGNLLFYAQETVNVFKNLTTDTWRGNSSYLKDGTFTVSKENVDTFSMTTFFVQGTDGTYTPAAAAADSNSGTYFAPLRTVQAAVDKIESLNDGTSSYTVMVDGNFTAEDGDVRDPSSDWIAAFVVIEPSNKLNVTIRGISKDSPAVLNVNSNGRVFFIGGNASVTLEKLKVSNGSCIDNGGGIFCNGSLNLNYCSIENNRAGGNGGGILCYGNLNLNYCTFKDNRSEANGGAICFEGNSLNISGGEVTNNSGGSGGGGIFCNGKSSIMNCNFEGNSAEASFGGAIYFVAKSDGPAVTNDMSDCEIKNNKANNSSGGAIACGEKVSLNLFNGKVSGNRTNAGGAIYFGGGEGTILSIRDGFFSDNKSTLGAGGAISIDNYGKLQLGGSVTIETKDDVNDNDIYLATDKPIEIIGKLSPENSNYTARLSIPDCNIGSQPLVGGDGYKLTEDDYSKFLISDPNNKGWHINKYGYLTKPVSITEFNEGWNHEIYTDITVSNVAELKKFADLVSAGNSMEKFTINLTEDINMDDTDGFIGIGDENKPFSGTFDGNGKTIKFERKISLSGVIMDSIFFNVKNGTIKNLKSSGEFYRSGIVKEINNGVVENCENYANITGRYYVGGIVSKATNSSIIKCVNRGVVTVKINMWMDVTCVAGGICGSMDGGNILDCMNIGKISSSGAANQRILGGIIGKCNFIPSEKEDNGVFNSINRGDFSDSSLAGGIIGATSVIANSCAYVKNCLNTGLLTGSFSLSGDILCISGHDPDYNYEFGVSNCYFIKEPFGTYTDELGKFFKICKVNSFSKSDSQFSTNQPLTVGSVTSSDLVELLNAWVDEQNSSGGTYLKWKYTETTPVNLELVYEN